MKEKLKTLFSSRAFKSGAYAGALSALMVALVVAVNLVVSALPVRYTQFDMTDDALYSLSDETLTLAASLTSDVTIYDLSRSGAEDVMMQKLLAQYGDASAHIHVEQKDPVLYPTFAASYNAQDAAVGSLIVTCGDRVRVIDQSELYTQTINYETYSYDTAFAGETRLTSAISYVTSEEMPVLYTVTGHGEATLPTAMTNSVTDRNVLVQELNLLTGSVPEDAGAVLLNAPARDLSAEECATLSAYLANGGKLLLATSYATCSEEAMPNLSSLLAEYGMYAKEGIVVENNQDYYMTYPHFLLPEIGSHDITQPFMETRAYVFAPAAHAIGIADELPENVTVTPLFTTTDDAYIKLITSDNTPITQTDEDETGLFTVTAVAQNSETNGAIVWISAADMLTSDADTTVSGSNTDFLLNALNWSIGNETGISVHAKSVTTQYLTVPQSAGNLYSGLFTIVIPFFLLLAGVVIWAVRRKR